MVKKKKAKKTNICKVVKAKGDVKVKEKTAEIRIKTKVDGKEEEHEETYLLAFKSFPENIPLSQVHVRASTTTNMGNFNSMQIAVKLSDITMANAKARELTAEALADEAIALNAKIANKTAARLYEQTAFTE